MPLSQPDQELFRRSVFPLTLYSTLEPDFLDDPSLKWHRLRLDSADVWRFSFEFEKPVVSQGVLFNVLPLYFYAVGHISPHGRQFCAHTESEDESTIYGTLELCIEEQPYIISQLEWERMLLSLSRLQILAITAAGVPVETSDAWFKDSESGKLKLKVRGVIRDKRVQVCIHTKFLISEYLNIFY